MNRVIQGVALDVLSSIVSSTFDLIYVDPPFGTGNTQWSHRGSYVDPAENYSSFLMPHLSEAHRLLKPSGAMCLHLDWRNVHRAKLLCDDIFGELSFLNEIIWAYDFGGRGKDKWPRKHDNILVYVKTPKEHVFNWDEADRIPYMAPGLQKDESRAELGKIPTDVWWMSIVGTNSRERLGYPTQKPRKLIERFITALSPPNGLILDFFAGSGTTGDAALSTGRSFVLVDSSHSAIETMKQRFQDHVIEWCNITPHG